MTSVRDQKLALTRVVTAVLKTAGLTQADKNEGVRGFAIGFTTFRDTYFLTVDAYMPEDKESTRSRYVLKMHTELAQFARKVLCIRDVSPHLILVQRRGLYSHVFMVPPDQEALDKMCRVAGVR